MAGETADDRTTGQEGFKSIDSVPKKETFTLSAERDEAIDDVKKRALLDLERMPPHSPEGLFQALEDILKGPERDKFLDVWDMFVRLSQADKDQIRPLVIVYLSSSRSIVEAGRAITLFEQMSIDTWDHDTVSAAVVVLLRSGQQEVAMQVFERGLTVRKLLGGMEYLLIDTFNQQQWGKAIGIWLKYFKSLTDSDPNARADYELLNAPLSLPFLGSLYASFERYLAADSRAVEKELKSEKVTRDGLWVLRRAFAKTCLIKQCPPREALVILRFWKDAKFYDQYLTGIFGVWYRKKITRTAMGEVAAIYDHYVRHPGAKPSFSVLRGMFKLYFPGNHQGLQTIYNDWLLYHGELNLWAFTKYMKYYASLGDVQTVRTLWNRCADAYPDFVTSPTGFYSLLNAHAQTGDIDGIQEELDRMVSEYGVEPDIDCWNAMLKGYTRTNDLDGALACFEDIRTNYSPDSFTYGQIMASSAKLGDLELTLDLFNQAQMARVNVTKEMVLPLVLAYCLNDRLKEADNIAHTLAERGITSTVIWNQLIHYNGMHGRLNRCYGILRDMTALKLEWSAETYTYLLQALITVNQLATAVVVLKEAAKSPMSLLKAEHYAIVIMGAARNGSRMYAESIMSMMNKRRIPVPFNAQVAYAKVSQQVAPHAVRTPQLRPSIVQSLRARVEVTEQDSRLRARETTNIGNALTLLLQAGDEAEAEELIKLYMSLDPNAETSHEMPQNVISSLMLAEQRKGRHAAVVRMWKTVWPGILHKATREEGEGIFPARQYEATRLMLRVAQSYRALGSGDDLEKDVLKVLEAGFKFTSVTWDHVIRILCEMGKWERAMELMEEYLMDGWRGWHSWEKDKARPIMYRRLEKSSRHVRPTTFAVSAVMKHWLDARKLVDWSGAVRQKLDGLKARHPRMHRAFALASWKDIRGPWTFSADVDFGKAVDGVLRGATYLELRAMDFYLGKELRRKTSEEPKFVKTSLHEVGRHMHMDPEDLKALRVSLEAALAEHRRKMAGTAAAAGAASEARDVDADALDDPEPPQPLDPFEFMLLNRRKGDPSPWKARRPFSPQTKGRRRAAGAEGDEQEQEWEASSKDLLLSIHLQNRARSSRHFEPMTADEMQALREQLSRMAPSDVKQTWDRSWKQPLTLANRY